jgi:hypothetical protein
VIEKFDGAMLKRRTPEEFCDWEVDETWKMRLRDLMA